MKFFYISYFSTKSKKRGFTLVELMVVVSIISLLSSIVLAAVKDARERAKARAFRSEVTQFITGIELYKAEKGTYPGTELTAVDVEIRTTKGATGAITYAETPTSYDYKTKLNPYMKKIPEPVKVGNYFSYGKYLASTKCTGDTRVPEYIIKVSATEAAFTDWPKVEGDINAYCFSLK